MLDPGPLLSVWSNNLLSKLTYLRLKPPTLNFLNTTSITVIPWDCLNRMCDPPVRYLNVRKGTLVCLSSQLASEALEVESILHPNLILQQGCANAEQRSALPQSLQSGRFTLPP